MQLVRPTPSFQILLPDDICSDDDPRVMSYWVDGDPVVLLISSYLRTISAEQLSAVECLQDHKQSHPENWTPIDSKLCLHSLVDEAAASIRDKQGTHWMHAFLVWPHMRLYVTVLGPRPIEEERGSWAFAAIRSIAPTIQ
jgi:hypothetical protein